MGDKFIVIRARERIINVVENLLSGLIECDRHYDDFSKLDYRVMDEGEYEEWRKNNE